MDLKEMYRSIAPYLNRVLRLIDRKVSWVIWFLKSHYTWLSVIVFVVAGCIFIFLKAWFCRYDWFDWWRWKGRALRKCIFFSLTLCVAKILILEL